MSRFYLGAVLVFLCSGLALGQGARIILTPARLHRLQRDRERNTPRWINFERHVKTVPTSPDRGFELALYSIVASDEDRGREAVAWAIAHPCERRQTALILNWMRELVTDEQRKQIVDSACPATNGGPYQRLRDLYFWAVALGEDNDFKPEPLNVTDLPAPDELYALIEYLDAYRTREGRDLRADNAAYFQSLPALLLLHSPDDFEHPSWQAHVAALALVDLDPNLESSQFLQSWGMEDRFLITSGPGVAYEFLWADPYLPGLGYENLQPWLYSESEATLWARSSWMPDACWLHIWPGHQDVRNCPPDWDKAPARFGRLILAPMDKQCYEAPRALNRDALILRTPKPDMKLTEMGSKPRLTSSDAAGLKRWQANGYTAICMDKNATRGR